MNETEFHALFGAKGWRPTINAITGERLQKSDNFARQRLEGTPYYVLHTGPLSAERLAELVRLAKAGPAVEKAAKVPAKDQ